VPLPHSLIRMVPWAQYFLREVLRPGDHAADLTAGNGYDSLFLFECVGNSGRVVAIDIQEEALEHTAERLRKAGAEVHLWSAESDFREGVYLVRGDHAHLGRFCREPLRAVIANLGYRPGGDPSIATRSETTASALISALDLLMPGGRLAVVAYVGHPGGKKEADRVEGIFNALPPEKWLTLQLSVPNRSSSPYLLLAEKTSF
jgi:predicted methyltransferase